MNKEIEIFDFETNFSKIIAHQFMRDLFKVACTKKWKKGSASFHSWIDKRGNLRIIVTPPK